jgi:beta-glucosidase
VVEPGELELWVGGSCADRATEACVVLGGEVYAVGLGDERWTVATTT